MADRPTVDLLTNLPFTGTVKYADVRQGQYGERLKLVILPKTGQEHYPGQGEHECWLPINQLEPLKAAGAITETTGTRPSKDDPEVKEMFRKLSVKSGSVLSILVHEEKQEDGKKQKRYGVSLNGTPLGVNEGTAAARAAAPGAAALGQNANNGATPPTGHAPAKDPAARRKQNNAAWLALGEEFGTALVLAKRQLEFVVGTVPPEVLQASAATILIRAEKIGLAGSGYVGMRKAFEHLFTQAQLDQQTTRAQPPAETPPPQSAEEEDYDEEPLPF